MLNFYINDHSKFSPAVMDCQHKLVDKCGISWEDAGRAIDQFFTYFWKEYPKTKSPMDMLTIYGVYRFSNNKQAIIFIYETNCLSYRNIRNHYKQESLVFI